MHEEKIKEATDKIAKILVDLLMEIRTINQQPLAEIHMAKTKDEWMTKREFAAYRKVSGSTVYKWLKAGMPSFKDGGVTRINTEVADLWLATGGLEKRKAKAKR